MHPPDELDEYLRGDSALSCQYRREPAPLAFAASVLLSVALVLAIVFGPQGSKRADDTPRVMRVAYSSDPKLVRPPRAWLADIAALRRAGRTHEADEELRRFRSAYPRYSIGDPP